MRRALMVIGIGCAFASGFSWYPEAMAASRETYFTFRVGYGVHRLPVRTRPDQRLSGTLVESQDSIGANVDDKNRAPLAKFMRDRTLRRGDAVVTCEGIFVFTGLSGGIRREADFKLVSNVNPIPPSLRSVLSTLKPDECTAVTEAARRASTSDSKGNTVATQE